jgi:hypothetical protein
MLFCCCSVFTLKRDRDRTSRNPDAIPHHVCVRGSGAKLVARHPGGLLKRGGYKGAEVYVIRWKLAKCRGPWTKAVAGASGKNASRLAGSALVESAETPWFAQATVRFRPFAGFRASGWAASARASVGGLRSARYCCGAGTVDALNGGGVFLSFPSGPRRYLKGTSST